MKKTYQTITPEIRHAIADVIAYKFKKNNKLAEAVKVSPVAVGKWLKVGEQGSIETDVYKRLFPLIEEYLKKTKPCILTDPECLKICSGLSDSGKKMLREYKELNADRQDTINTLVEVEWKKNHADCPTGSGHCGEVERVDMDKSKAG